MTPSDLLLLAPNELVEIAPSEAAEELLRIAGDGSEIAKKYNLRFHRVTIAEYPETYASRLVELTPRGFKRLRLRAFEVHDLVPAKLGRTVLGIGPTSSFSRAKASSSGVCWRGDSSPSSARTFSTRTGMWLRSGCG
jgi:hypothetical protein